MARRTELVAMPREYLATPMLFGSGSRDSVNLVGVADREPWWTDEAARAALVQSEIAYTVQILLRGKRMSLRGLSDSLGAQPRHLYRLLRGEEQITVFDLVRMSDALGHNLVEYRSVVDSQVPGGDMVPVVEEAVRVARRRPMDSGRPGQATRKPLPGRPGRAPEGA